MRIWKITAVSLKNAGNSLNGGARMLVINSRVVAALAVGADNHNHNLNLNNNNNLSLNNLVAIMATGAIGATGMAAGATTDNKKHFFVAKRAFGLFCFYIIKSVVISPLTENK